MIPEFELPEYEGCDEQEFVNLCEKYHEEYFRKYATNKIRGYFLEIDTQEDFNFAKKTDSDGQIVMAMLNEDDILFEETLSLSLMLSGSFENDFYTFDAAKEYFWEKAEMIARYLGATIISKNKENTSCNIEFSKEGKTINQTIRIAFEMSCNPKDYSLL